MSVTEAARSTSGRVPVSRRACRCSSIRARRSAGTSPPFPANVWAAPAFTYYAVIRDNTTGRSIVVPPGGSSAPQVSFATNSSVHRPRNAHVRIDPQASARVASAGWGSGDQQVGLEDGVDMPTGAASFDVDPAGERVPPRRDRTRGCWSSSAGGAPQAIPLPGLAGVKADLRVSDSSGTAYVLEVANVAAPRPLLRSFTLAGRSSDARPP